MWIEGTTKEPLFPSLSLSFPLSLRSTIFPHRMEMKFNIGIRVAALYGRFSYVIITRS